MVYNGEDGIAILLDLDGADDSPGYYRYNFEETYKIISPFTFPYDLVYRDGQFIEIPKTKEERVCYNTFESDEIILVSSTAVSENDLGRVLVHFIESQNPVLAQRYSILVRQMAISEEAFAYNETLKDLAGSGSLLSQNQPGFINGNVFSVSNPEEKVIGFFTVAATDKEIIFFNFEYYFDDGETTEWFMECNISRPDISLPSLLESLASYLESGKVKYLGTTLRPGQAGEGPIRVVEAGCVDCTEWSTNVKPDFWIE